MTLLTAYRRLYCDITRKDVRDLALSAFDGQNKAELSMIEVAREILHERHETIAFQDLVQQVQEFTGKSDEEIQGRLAQFYTDLNIDGSFISLGDNVWGLRSWYPIDSIDEAVHLDLEEETTTKKKKRKKVNAFLADVADDDDVIDYNDDDPEDDDDFEVEGEETATVADDDDDTVKEADQEEEADSDEFAAGLGDDITGVKTKVDDDYGSGDIEL
ncbi:DNA-directed RNA polymerase subunit delta [Weissella soli]|uniref:Probable DNA-directed RNA polymerase subunit delta n=1 Tax=Weissella soli TaxID=155866 RepID=A0A288QV37_9LACO|nr:putative DNA-directed RNA polymerase subunit delta [Weissella soli]MCT8395632.1 DNA-directed RNA polymerase subunit delta [Weissella soli]QEA35591.1 DNA-directed RNA polymerase subunit delta [Weissella soli]QEA35761.1 DNA-directed RNA polymerase subunit delta [Weissella soli]RDL05279.1 DNA-directed RNA polymerase subunit delta [Weissella soli]